jgi:hypothetical protein
MQQEVPKIWPFQPGTTGQLTSSFRRRKSLAAQLASLQSDWFNVNLGMPYGGLQSAQKLTLNLMIRESTANGF